VPSRFDRESLSSCSSDCPLASGSRASRERSSPKALGIHFQDRGLPRAGRVRPEPSTSLRIARYFGLPVGRLRPGAVRPLARRC
jgi:hypothetical protein